MSSTPEEILETPSERTCDHSRLTMASGFRYRLEYCCHMQDQQRQLDRYPALDCATPSYDDEADNLTREDGGRTA